MFLNRKYDIISKLVDVAKHAVKEKIVRITVAIFRVNDLIKRKNEEKKSNSLLINFLSYLYIYI